MAVVSCDGFNFSHVMIFIPSIIIKLQLVHNII